MVEMEHLADKIIKYVAPKKVWILECDRRMSAFSNKEKLIDFLHSKIQHEINQDPDNYVGCSRFSGGELFSRFSKVLDDQLFFSKENVITMLNRYIDSYQPCLGFGCIFIVFRSYDMQINFKIGKELTLDPKFDPFVFLR